MAKQPTKSVSKRAATTTVAAAATAPKAAKATKKAAAVKRSAKPKPAGAAAPTTDGDEATVSYFDGSSGRGDLDFGNQQTKQFDLRYVELEDDEYIRLDPGTRVKVSRDASGSVRAIKRV